MQEDRKPQLFLRLGRNEAGSRLCLFSQILRALALYSLLVFRMALVAERALLGGKKRFRLRIHALLVLCGGVADGVARTGVVRAEISGH